MSLLRASSRLAQAGLTPNCKNCLTTIHLVAHVCGDPLPRYTCRTTRVAADFLGILGFYRCSSSIVLHSLKGPVAPVARVLSAKRASQAIPQRERNMGSQYPSPNVKTFRNFEPQNWPEIVTSRDAESTCFKRSRTSCDVTILGIFGPNFGQKRLHHVMDASCQKYRHMSVTNPVATANGS